MLLGQFMDNHHAPRVVCRAVVLQPTLILAIGPDALEVGMVRLDHIKQFHRRIPVLNVGRQHGNLD